MGGRAVTVGTFVKVFELGVLLTGPSGIGKSELALALIDRGHSLIADDGPEFYLDEEGEVAGRCPEGFLGFMEIRGLGIVDVERMFGSQAVQAAWPLNLVLRLTPHDTMVEQDRFQVHPEMVTVAGGVSVPMLTLAVGGGRDPALIVEAAVRRQQLLNQGYDAGEVLASRLDKKLGKGEA